MPPRALESLTRVRQISCRLLAGAQAVADVGVGEHAGQAVRAEEVEVARPHLHLAHVHQHVALAAEGAGDHVLERMGARLLLGEEARHHLLVDPGVVLGELVEAAVAQAVGPAVADVRHRGARAPSSRKPTTVVPMP